MRCRAVRSVRTPLAASALLLLLLGCTTPPSPTAPPASVLAPPAAMHVEGVPPLDAALVPALRRYAEVTGHGIADWHPTAREMLVVHRARGLALVASVPLDRGARGDSPAARTALTTRLTLVYPLAPEAPGGRRVVAELPGAGWFGGDVSPDETRLALTRYYSATHSEVWLLELPRVTADTTPPTTATPRRLL